MYDQLKPNDLVLFQGDSITDAHRMPNEANDLFQLGAGYAGMVSARVRLDRPIDRISFVNRGVSGNTTRELLARWQPDCLDLRPNVLSLLIGINDSNAHTRGELGHDPESYRDRLHVLLATTRDYFPKIRLVLMEPFLIAFDAVRERQVADVTQRQTIVREVAQRFDAVFVPLQAPLEQLIQAAGRHGYACYDTIHPTAAGHRLIADAWLRAVS